MLSKFALFAVLASVSCTPVKEYGVADNLVGAVSECLEVDTSLCLKVIIGLQSDNYIVKTSENVILESDNVKRIVFRQWICSCISPSWDIGFEWQFNKLICSFLVNKFHILKKTKFGSKYP